MPNVAPPYALEAVAHLKRVDPLLGAVIDRVGPYAPSRRPERFHALVQAIIFQQLAGRAAQTIFDRFVQSVGGGRFPTPEVLLAASDDSMRSAGLSRGKMSYIRDLATHVSNRTLNFHRHSRMTDDEVIADLTRVRGIGRWTAEMFLMFNLHRPDVLHVDDLGVRNAVARLYAMPVPPPPKELRIFGERWSPYRTVASWYLWQSLNLLTPSTTPTPTAPNSTTTPAPASAKAAKAASAANTSAKVSAKPSTKTSPKPTKSPIRPSAKPSKSPPSSMPPAKAPTKPSIPRVSKSVAGKSKSVEDQRKSIVAKPPASATSPKNLPPKSAKT
jgi:DNA-3-methyladenine glycosylase II